MAAANLVLFTGAGFSRGAVSSAGLAVPGVRELKSDLWKIAFPGKPAALESEALADIYGVAMNKSQHAVGEILKRNFRIDYSATPERYRRWFSLPWHRHYTLNIDDLDEAIAAKSALPRAIKAVSGNVNHIEQTNALLSVHLNGRLAEFPKVTFSPTDFAERLTAAEVWYHQAVTDIMTHPVIYIGASLDESGLWQHIEMRRQRQPQSAELRPRSYLVTPYMSEARAALLKANFNVDWIQLGEKEFFEQVISNLTAESERGHIALGQSSHDTRHRVVLRTPREAFASQNPADPSSYLMGREPCVDDILTGFAIDRTFEGSLLEATEIGKRGGIFLTGTAATGKSTTALRLALKCEALGLDVHVLDPVLGDLNPGHIASQLARSEAKILFLDNADALGDRLLRLIEALSDMSPRPFLIAAARSSKLQRLDISAELQEYDIREVTVPNLNNDDIDLLLDSLTRANRLGLLSGMKDMERRKILRDQCGRQLVVAMYKATLGEMFHERIMSECEDLAGVSRLAYAMLALTTAEGHYLTQEELEFGLAVSGNGLSNDDLNDIRKLLDRGLVLRNGVELRLRHRWIADTTIEFLSNNGIIGPPVRALISTLAARVSPATRHAARESRLLRRLINHDYLKRLTDIDTVRGIYESVETRLTNDYHYWLQRGSLEVEIGDLNMADFFLTSAASLAPDDDTFVLTEFAYSRLKRASHSPAVLQARNWADGALADLESVIRIRGGEDSYPYHVYGSQGLSWARRAPISTDERRDLLVRLRNTVETGTQLHPRAIDLRNLHRDLEKEVLLQSTIPKS